MLNMSHIEGLSFTDPCFMDRVGVTEVLDLGCIISRECKSMAAQHSRYLFILMALPFIVILILFLFRKIEDRCIKKEGRSFVLFHKIYVYQKLNLYYGWDGYNDFKIWVYELGLLVACMIGAILLYLNGGFEWLRIMLL